MCVGFGVPVLHEGVHSRSIQIYKYLFDCLAVGLGWVCRVLKELEDWIRYVDTTDGHGKNQFSNCLAVTESHLCLKLLNICWVFWSFLDQSKIEADDFDPAMGGYTQKFILDKEYNIDGALVDHWEMLPPVCGANIAHLSMKPMHNGLDAYIHIKLKTMLSSIYCLQADKNELYHILHGRRSDILFISDY
jgi:hypothetical protein